jgi:hypothetical protein
MYKDNMDGLFVTNYFALVATWGQCRKRRHLVLSYLLVKF